MKRLFLTICLSIIISGNYNAFHNALASKYSDLYPQRIEIEFTDKMTGKCNHDKNIGCITWIGMNYKIQISNKLEWVIKRYKINNKLQVSVVEQAMNHEIGHALLRTGEQFVSEDRADNYANEVIKSRTVYY